MDKEGVRELAYREDSGLMVVPFSRRDIAAGEETLIIVVQ